MTLGISSIGPVWEKLNHLKRDASDGFLAGVNFQDTAKHALTSKPTDQFVRFGSTTSNSAQLDVSSNRRVQWSPRQLIDAAVKAGEGKVSKEGALVINTTPYTGRSPKDRFIVDDLLTQATVSWNGENKAISGEVFDRIHQKMLEHLKGKSVYEFNGFSGADARYRMPVRFYTESAAQNLFVHNMFIRPKKGELKNFSPEFTVIACPSLKLDPKTDGVRSEVGILVNYSKKLVLIAGTSYSGELKKGIFTIMNHRLTDKGVLPLHSAATVVKGDRVSLILGLSGTGKTTLALSDDQKFIGDDEIGWSEHGVFNMEGGCYATANHLTRAREPKVWDAVKPGTLAENITLDPTSQSLNFADSSLSENTRLAFPVRNIQGVKRSGFIDKHPDTIVFLTSDAFGVLPPVSKLTKGQALAHFTAGYTSKLGGTERGINEPQATFSAGFGAPFLPRPIATYTGMLKDRLDKHPATVYLLNTGWQGGPYGVGQRIGLPETRAILKAALHGDLEQSTFVEHPIFKVQVPTSCPGVPDKLLDPKANWANPSAYDTAAHKLQAMFDVEFAKVRST